MSSILALDQGTTGSTALLVHQDGTILGRGYREFTQSYPQPGWVEHDPEEIVRVSLEAMREALAASGEPPAGLGITNQRETVVMWERASLAPVGPAIVWQDRRTADRCRELRDNGAEALLRQRTGLVADPYFSATKLEWLLRDPVLRRRAERGELAAGTVESWLVARLTGGRVHVTDHTNASRTLLYSLDDRAWDPELLALFGVPSALLPAIVPSAGVVGETDPSLLGVALPIAGLAGDQQAALFGQGCCVEGAAKNTYGTGAFLLVFTGSSRPSPGPGILATAACGPRGEPAFALEGSVFIAGAAVQWLRDGLGLLATAAESEALAATVPDTGGVSFVPAFVGLGTPHWEAEARGTITGITRGTSRAHLVRAALEAMAFSSAELLEAMAGDGCIGV
ncbi:MAG: FGGY family carbohydrate kinase, partial [Catenulispora sp.]